MTRRSHRRRELQEAAGNSSTNGVPSPKLGVPTYPPMSYTLWVRSVDNPLPAPAAGWHREAAHAVDRHRPVRPAHLPDEGDRRGVLPADHLHGLPDLLLRARTRPH